MVLSDFAQQTGGYNHLLSGHSNTGLGFGVLPLILAISQASLSIPNQSIIPENPPLTVNEQYENTNSSDPVFLNFTKKYSGIDSLDEATIRHISIALDFGKKLLSETQDSPPEFMQAFKDNIWELV